MVSPFPGGRSLLWPQSGGRTSGLSFHQKLGELVLLQATLDSSWRLVFVFCRVCCLAPFLDETLLRLLARLKALLINRLGVVLGLLLTPKA